MKRKKQTIADDKLLLKSVWVCENIFYELTNM